MKHTYLLLVLLFSSTLFSQNEFITTWETTTANETITIPGHLGTLYTVDWGDGVVTNNNDGDAIHTYVTAGIHTVKISGGFSSINFNNTGDKVKILSVEQWGNINWIDMTNAFYGCSNLIINANDIPNLTAVENLENMFRGCTSLNQNISNWNVSNIKNMRNMFRDATMFNEDISNWNVSSVTNMNRMFRGATDFNKDLSNWNVANVTDMGNLFRDTSFNQNLGSWSISKVITMSEMFSGAAMSTANYDNTLIGWADTNVQSSIPIGVTLNAGATNYCLGEDARSSLVNTYNWIINDLGKDVSCLTDFITKWKTNNTSTGSSNSNQVTIPTDGGGYNYTVNWGDGSTNVGVLGDITHTYAAEGEYTITINGNFSRIVFNNSGDRLKLMSIEQWGDAEWRTMRNAFRGCDNLVINATDAPDLSSVTDMSYMFAFASNFNSDISNWDISNITLMTDLLKSTAFSTVNYDLLLISWVAQEVKSNVVFSVGNTKYCSGKSARLSLESEGNNWDITDGGFDISCEEPFVSEWDTNSASEEIHIPILAGESYNYTIDWGDGTIETNVITESRHIYASPGVHTISITGNFPRIYFSTSDSKNNLQTITQWGTTTWTSMENAFKNCDNVTIQASDIPYFSFGTSLKSMFDSAQYFNSDISNWNVFNVTDMSYMFSGAYDFNHELSNWNVTNVTNMAYMFSEATVFNKDISNWNVSNVTDMRYMFELTEAFNQSLSGWNVENVLDMSSMFSEALVFNQDLSNWNVANVTDMSSMFSKATNFNSDISNWSTAKVTDMSYMFDEAISFNQNIANWNVSLVTEFKEMFAGATSFNQDISNWNVGNATTMNYMFEYATNFNQDISNWNVGKVERMSYMFRGATNFDQNLSNWDLSSINSLSRMFNEGSLSISNYDAILIGWAIDSSGVANDGIDDIPTDINFDGGNSYYCAATNARNILTSAPYNWNIDDKGGCDKIPFITTWQTTTTNEEIHISTIVGSTYNYTIDWGDGAIDNNVTGDIRHNYANPGVHIVSISGDFPRIYFKDSDTKNKLLTVQQWGATTWTNMYKAFEDCANLTITATDTPDLSLVTATSYMFNNCTNLSGDLSNWDVSNVENMDYMFASTEAFNSNISNWDVSNAMVLARMFNGATAFNQDLSNWDVSSVYFMNYMFNGATAFNQTLANWDISSIVALENMLNNSGMSISNYDATLIGWATLDTNETKIPTNTYFDALNVTYCMGENARNLLTSSIAEGGYNWNITDAGKECNVLLSPKVFLQGAFINPNAGEETLMRDDLRTGDYLPTTSPYADALVCDSSVFNTGGLSGLGAKDDDIVDWVWVELLDNADGKTVIDSQSALLQRDGDVVGVDGISSLEFTQDSGNYYIKIIHRNHISIRSASAIALSSTITSINFSNDTNLVSGGANALIDMGNGMYAMPSGDYDGNGQVQNSDLSSVIQSLGSSGYLLDDMDMNGQVQNSDINELININIGKGEQF